MHYDAIGNEIPPPPPIGFTVLYAASQEGHLEVVRYLCSEGADVEAASDAGKTPLFAAVLQDQKAVVKCLVHEYGADVNHRSYNGRTPLFAALENDLEEMATFLVVEMKAGLEIACACGCKRTPLSQALLSGKTSFAEMIVQFGAKHDHTYLLQAAKPKDDLVDAVRYMVEELGYDVNVRDEHQNTPLIVAASNGNLAITKALVAFKADVSLVNDEAFSAPMRAALNRQESVAEYLRSLDHKHCCLETCDAEGTKRCTRCKASWYCSRGHQNEHWGLHKQACKAIDRAGKGGGV